MRIGHNANAFRAHASMQRADRGIAIATRRLSSGLRIARSADDPAGNSISNKLSLQAQGTARASQNSSNIISALHTADGALNEMHTMLGRLQTLAVQAANDTNVLEDRQRMQLEIDAIIEEINQTASKTEFNRLRLLGGEAGRIALTSYPFIDVVSIDQELPFGIFSFDLTAAPTPTTLVTGPGSPLPNPALEGQVIAVNGMRIALSSDDSAASIRTKLAEALSATDFILTPGPGLFGTIQALYSGSGYTLDIAGDPLVLAALGLDGPVTLGTDASLANFGGVLQSGTVYASNGNQITIVDTSGSRVRLELPGGIPLGPVDIRTLPSPMVAQTGPNADMHLRMDIPRVNSKMLGISRINVRFPEGAQDAIERSYAAIEQVSAVRSRIGAYTNRLEHTVTNLDVAEVDVRSSLSRIRDADMALEMVDYTKNQVIYQAGMAVLAQANTTPLQIVQLLT